MCLEDLETIDLKGKTDDEGVRKGRFWKGQEGLRTGALQIGEWKDQGTSDFPTDFSQTLCQIATSLGVSSLILAEHISNKKLLSLKCFLYTKTDNCFKLLTSVSYCSFVLNYITYWLNPLKSTKKIYHVADLSDEGINTDKLVSMWIVKSIRVIGVRI